MLCCCRYFTRAERALRSRHAAAHSEGSAHRATNEPVVGLNLVKSARDDRGVVTLLTEQGPRMMCSGLAVRLLCRSAAWGGV